MIVPCLQCLKGFEWESYVYRSRTGEISPQLRNRPESLIAQLRDRAQGVVWVGPAERAALLARGDQLHCPDGHWVPADLKDTPTVVIGLIGPPGSSKSCYLAASIGLMLRGGLADFNVAVHLHAFSQAHYFATYDSPFWYERTAMAKNLPAADRVPIALELQGVINRRRVNVVFFDAAGEDLISATQQAKHALYLANAGALIFLAEPASLPGLAGAVAGSGPIIPPDTVIRNTADTLEVVQNRSAAERRIPAAIVLAKSDQLDGYAGVTAEMTGDPNDLGHRMRPSDLYPIIRRSSAIASFLGRHAAANLFLTAQTSFPRHTFHMASAAGGPADPTSRRFLAEVKPRRCLDPIVWLLVELGVLDPPERYFR